MINYNWNITSLWTKTVNDKQDYVVVAAFEVNGVDGEFSSVFSDSVQFSTENVGPFVPYSDLTEEVVISWVKQSLGESGILSIEACIVGQINSEKNPPIVPVNSPLPWS